MTDLELEKGKSGISSIISSFETPEVDIREKKMDTKFNVSDKPLY